MSTSRKKSQSNQRDSLVSSGRLEEKQPRHRASKTEFPNGEYSVPKNLTLGGEQNYAAKQEQHSTTKAELHSTAKAELHSAPPAHAIFDTPNADAKPNNRRKKPTQNSQNPQNPQNSISTTDLKEENIKTGANTSPTTSTEQNPPLIPNTLLSYSFIYFIRLLDNTKSDESTYKIGYSNDVPAYRRQLEANMPQNVKTMRVLQCKKGDADKISAELCASIKSRELRSSWFRIKKEELDTIANTLISKHQCEVVSESKAVVKPAKKSRKPLN